MGEALSAVEALYFGLQQKIGMLSLASRSQGQRDAFMSQYVAARTAYWSCVNKMFHDDDPQVIALTTQLKAATDEVTKSEKELGDISKVIDDVTEAVTIASKLATLAVG